MINKVAYLQAKKIVEQFEQEQKELDGYALVYGYGKIKKENLKNWLDKFFAQKLKNKPKIYSTRLWEELKEMTIFVDGVEYCLVRYDEELLKKWF